MRVTFGVIANHFGQVIRQIFWALRIIFGRLRITFQMNSPKCLFIVLTPFLTEFPLFRQVLCIKLKNANKLQIMIRNCESLCQSDSKLRSENHKMENHFSFLKSSPAYIHTYIHTYVRICSYIYIHSYKHSYVHNTFVRTFILINMCMYRHSILMRTFSQVRVHARL